MTSELQMYYVVCHLIFPNREMPTKEEWETLGKELSQESQSTRKL